MKAPEIDLEELKRMKEENFRQRLEFIDFYAEWLKKSSKIPVQKTKPENISGNEFL